MKKLESAVNHPRPELSVVVCTFNRCDCLRICLDSLIQQECAPDRYEIVVVDNNSTDDTKSVIKHFAKHSACVLRYVNEPRQGLAHARNRGFQECFGDIIAYVDDDARVPGKWSSMACQAFLDFKDADIACGPYYPFTLKPAPKWFPLEYGQWQLNSIGVRILRKTEFFQGTNMIFTHKALNKLGGFPIHLGMQGPSLGYGEETSVCLKAHAMGMKIIYIPSMVVEHAILPSKYKLTWLLKSAYINGKCNPSIFGRRAEPLRCGLKIPSFLIKDVWGVLRSTKGLPLKRRLFYGLKGSAFQAGVVRQMVTMKNRRSES